MWSKTFLNRDFISGPSSSAKQIFYRTVVEKYWTNFWRIDMLYTCNIIYGRPLGRQCVTMRFYTSAVEQQYPAGYFRTPGVQNKIFRLPKCDFRGWQFEYSLMYFFWKETKFLKAWKCYYLKEGLSSLIIPANITNITLNC